MGGNIRNYYLETLSDLIEEKIGEYVFDDTRFALSVKRADGQFPVVTVLFRNAPTNAIGALSLTVNTFNPINENFSVLCHGGKFKGKAYESKIFFDFAMRVERVIRLATIKAYKRVA